MYVISYGRRSRSGRILSKTRQFFTYWEAESFLDYVQNNGFEVFSVEDC